LFLFFKTAKFDTNNRWGVLDTALYDKVCQWLAAGQWFSLDTPVSSTNKTDCHDITWNIVESDIKLFCMPYVVCVCGLSCMPYVACVCGLSCMPYVVCVCGLSCMPYVACVCRYLESVNQFVMTTVDKQIFRIGQPVCHDDRRQADIYNRSTSLSWRL
jgi:hypothetical protein